MASKILNWSAWMSAPTQERLGQSKAYRLSRYFIVALLIALAIVTLMGAWWFDYKRVLVEDTPQKPLLVNAFINEIHRAPTFALYQADLALGILGIILGITILGSRKQPFNLVMMVIGAIFIIILLALIGLSYDTTEIVRVFAPAPVKGV